MLLHFLIISSISTGSANFNYKVFNIATDWSNEEVSNYNAQNKKAYEKNMKVCKAMYDEDQCELMNGYLKNTIFIKAEGYGGHYGSYVKEDTDFIIINVYSPTLTETPVQFSFDQDVSVNVYIKGVSKDSLLLEEDKFAFIQENSQKMFRKIMKNYYHINVPIDNLSLSANYNNKKSAQVGSRVLKIYGSSFDKIPFLYIESLLIEFALPVTLNSVAFIDSGMIAASGSVITDYLYTSLDYYMSHNHNNINVYKQSTVVLEDKEQPEATSNFYNINYYSDGILIFYKDSPDKDYHSLLYSVPFGNAKKVGIVANSLDFVFSCYDNSQFYSTGKVNVTVAESFNNQLVNLLDEKKKIKINVQSPKFNSDSFIINYDKSKYEIERVDELSDIAISEENKYVYKPKADSGSDLGPDSGSDLTTSTLDDNEKNENPNDNPPKKQSNTGWIVGIVICIVIILALVGVIVFLVIRNKNGNQKSLREKEGDLSLI